MIVKLNSELQKTPVPVFLISLFLITLICGFSGQAFAQAPANDDFSNPQEITGLFGITSGTNVNATLEVGEPTTTDTFPGNRSVWFRWVAPATGSFTFGLTADFDSQLAVYTGIDEGSLTSQAESDPRGNGGDSVSFPATAGTTYQIRVTGFEVDSGSYALNWVWNVDPVYDRIFSFGDARIDAVANSQNAGNYPYGDLVQGSEGNYFGTTEQGGAFGQGTVFRVTPAGFLTTLVSFTGNSGNIRGSNPRGGLEKGVDGNFYGTTTNGGTNGFGTIFKISPAGALTTLVDFTGNSGSSPGSYPFGKLLLGSDGNFYGTTILGGFPRFGTVFKMTPVGELTTLVEFTNGTLIDGKSIKGSSPRGALVQTSNGSFYGTTSDEGNNLFDDPEAPIQGNGTIFEIQIDDSTGEASFQTLVEFTGITGLNRGRAPLARLVEGPGGMLFGTTRAGGTKDRGTIFSVNTNGDSGDQLLTSLWYFNRISDGVHPRSSLIPAGDGVATNFYGTTSSTVFKISTDGTTAGTTRPQTLVSLTGTGGSNPGSFIRGSLIRGSDGSFYGTSLYGGANERGTMFKIRTDGTELGTSHQTLVEFGGGIDVGLSPLAGMVLGSDSNFYGTTLLGGTGNLGTVYRMTPGGVVTTLANLNFTTHSSWSPHAGLVEDSAGNFYGTTRSESPGTIYKITPTGDLTTLENLAGTGIDPLAALVQGPDENGKRVFYGTTQYGGTTDNGIVFKMSTDSTGTTLTTLVNFTGNVGPALGNQPRAALVLGSDGNFYGTTQGGGVSNKGTIFMMTPSGVLTTLVDLTGVSGARPVAALTKASDENGRQVFYGTTRFGGTSDDGTAFKMSTDGTPEPAGTTLTTLVNFTDTVGPSLGSQPRAALTRGSDGNFYGTTYLGGTQNFGTVFKMTPEGALTTLVEFINPDDGYPRGDLIDGGDGNLYGTTSGSGSTATDNSGAIYRLVFPGPPSIGALDASEIGTMSAVFQAKANARGVTTQVFVDYATDESVLGTSGMETLQVGFGLTGFSTQLVGTTLPDLEEGTKYYYRFRAVSSDGVTISPVQSTTTLAEPVVVSLPATEIAPTSASLNGTVNARNYDSSVVIEWGTDGNSFPNTETPTPPTVTGNAPVPVNVLLAGLNTGGTYFYRIVATNAGGTVTSGAQSFRTLIPATAEVTASKADTSFPTTRAQVTGFVDPKGSSASVSFEYGTNGTDFPNSFTAFPASVSGDQETEVTATLTGLTQGTTYHFRIRATGPGGTGVSDISTFTLSVLSGLQQQFPPAPAARDRTVTVTFNNTEIGAWRFTGETEWRISGETAGNLTNGLRVIDYLPVSGFIRPPSETVEVTSENIMPPDRLNATTGKIIELERTYFGTLTPGSGSLTVRLKPDLIAAPGVEVTKRAQWRLLGETNEDWKDSGVEVTGLPPGNHVVECKPIAGRETPSTISIAVAEADADSEDLLTLTYFTANDPVGLPPRPQSFADVSTNESLPYAYVGQIRSEVGSSTGFVVKSQVVATAGHVVFDDGTLSAVTNLQWLFQRHTGEHEPEPLVPRGFYVATGYDAQRITDDSPGEGSAESQKLDYAALYFNKQPAGRGGYGGYLASDSGAENEFLTSAAKKILVGYPVEGISDATNRGKLHATDTFTDALESFSAGKTWTTTAVHGLGGISGGPLFVRFKNGNDLHYLPAAIYLGGAGQTIVRAIDSGVVNLFLHAEFSALGGDNNTGGGSTHTSVMGNLNVTAKGALKVIIEPDGANNSIQAHWKLDPDTTPRPGGAQKSDLSAGTYKLTFNPVAGFVTPTLQTVPVTGGQLTTFIYTYQEEVTVTPLETWRQENFQTTENTGDAADNEDPDKDGVKNIDEFTAGTDPNSAADVFKITDPTKSGNTFTASCAGKAGRTYKLQRNPALDGMWSTVDTRATLPSDGSVTLTDTSAPSGSAYYRIEVSMP